MTFSDAASEIRAAREKLASPGVWKTRTWIEPPNMGLAGAFGDDGNLDPKFDCERGFANNPASEFVREAIWTLFPSRTKRGQHPMIFDDHPDTTQEDVLAVLDLALELAQ